LVELRQPPGRGRSRALRGLARELRWLPFGLPRAARAAGVEVLHCPGPLGPPRRIGVPTVVTINDVMALHHPAWFTRANVVHARLVVRRLVEAAAIVLTPSQFSRGQISEAWDVAPERIHVTPYGLDERFAPGPVDEALLQRLGIRRPYALTVGKLQPRKNIEAAIRTFDALGADRLALVIAGARGWHDEALLGLVDASAARERIHLTGNVADDDLVGLYRGAACFAFPSRGEGFGFPPLEAMACGTPVVCSDAGSLPEVVGDAALTFDPEDSAALGAALARALEPATAADLRARGLARAATFTWKRCAHATIAAYAAAVDQDC
ncbi:MAG TPA: glycosyltransferase family 1 protein, partial [Solirubrobacteraceae bacterium]|nr:glycosyltransferase family 1 protein [Solirubrobacteraceae bacterium]